MTDSDRIVLFDGVCNLCNGSVQFIIRNDKEGKLKFASLQSDNGQQLLSRYSIDRSKVDSIVFIDQGKAYIESTAALRIAGYLDGLWKILVVFRIVPVFIRDAVYRWIARNRYRWFGKQDSCMMPEPGVRERFLEDAA